jgi:adenylate kinase
MNIVLIGAQGSGKGTQAELLTQALNLQHVASGNLFRKAIDERTPAGVQASAYINRGELVPDRITVAMVLQHIAELDRQQGVLLDGFPRTPAQARALDQGFRKISRQVNMAVYLVVPRSELLARLSGRFICRAEQHIYHMRSHPPRVAGICDLDGSPLYQRPDDIGEAVQNRLDLFFQETVRVLDYYRDQQKLFEVNGNQSVERVQASLLNVLSQHELMFADAWR